MKLVKGITQTRTHIN